jgi:hypothetical protein
MIVPLMFEEPRSTWVAGLQQQEVFAALPMRLARARTHKFGSNLLRSEGDQFAASPRNVATT